jgi:hypothetical protein
MAALLGRLGLILAALAWIPHQVLCSTRERGDAAWLPVHVHVLLVGFGEPLALGASALRKLLADSLPVVTPTLVETGEPFEAAYALTYTVAHADDAQRHALQDAVVAAAIPADPAETMAAADVVVVDVDASQLEAAYARLLGGSSAAKAGAYTVVLQRLDASELAPRLAPRVPRAARVAHRLRYGARGIATQAFVGAGRFVVVDFSAAACAHGLLGAEEGAVSIELVPRLDPPPAAASHAETRASAVAALRAAAAVVVSAIAFVFAPSVRLCPDGPGANSALLLLVALRDHEAFDPFDPEPAAASPAGRVDTAAVERELLRVLPAPRAGAPAVRLLASTHPMHTHPALGVALASSIRSATTHELRHGRLAPVARPFVDAAELTAALARADDVLGGRLARAAAMAAAAGGARLLPLYVLSLAGEDPALALHANLVGHDRARRAEADTASGARGAAAAAAAPGLHGAAEGGLLSVSGTAVVVLAPPRDTIPSLGYFAEGRRLELDGREATRHALGGALGALGGVLPPHESFSLAHNRVETSFLWAVGAHPFGAGPPHTRAGGCPPLRARLRAAEPPRRPSRRARASERGARALALALARSFARSLPWRQVRSRAAASRWRPSRTSSPTSRSATSCSARCAPSARSCARRTRLYARARARAGRASCRGEAPLAAACTVLAVEAQPAQRTRMAHAYARVPRARARPACPAPRLAVGPVCL